MPPAKTPAAKARPTTRMIAERLGISRAAVSMALRGNLRVSESLRRRVAKTAEALGYRPDPELGRLMRHLRVRNKPRFMSTIVGLSSIPAAQERPYNSRLIEGAVRRADALGYKFDVLRIAAAGKRSAALQRMLVNRGIEGLVLLPMGVSLRFDAMLDWDRFSVVTATRSVLSPEFPRVLPNHFRNTLILCEELEKRGYRRIGLITPRDFDVQISPGLMAGVVWQNELGRTSRVAPLLTEEELPREEAIRAWYQAEKPDAIIVRGSLDAEVVVRALPRTRRGGIGLAVTNLEGSRAYAGMQVHPEEIGAVAVDSLHLRLSSFQRGACGTAIETLVLGSWFAGPTVRFLGAGGRRV
jgi:DNA-binding LacI/PurR family transcriptional regulator